MAKKGINKEIFSQNRITLKLEGDKVDVATFSKGVEDFLGLIREINAAFVAKKGDITWLISVDKGSQVFKATPYANVLLAKQLRKISESIDTGVDAVERGERPEGWSEKALEHIMGLCNRVKVSEDGVGVTSAHISANGKFKSLSPSTAVSIADILGKPKTAYGSITGKLKMMREGDGYYIRIIDDVEDISVVCSIPEEFLEIAKEGFTKRVSAYGRISYNKEGDPTNLVVENMRILREPKDIPSIYDVRGILNQ